MAEVAPALQLQGLGKTYPGAVRPALQGIDLQLPGGAISVVMGLSGSGKSTLLRLVNRLVAPSAGRVLCGSVDVTALAADYYDSRSKPDPKTGFPTAYHPANPAVWESVLPVCTFKGHAVTEIKFYPVDMGFRVPRPHQGTPRLADEVLGKQILERLAKMSEVYGTKIVVENGVGVWRASAAN